MSDNNEINMFVILQGWQNNTICFQMFHHAGYVSPKTILKVPEIVNFTPLCGSRKYPYSPHRRDWKFRGGGGVWKSQKFKAMYEAKLEFPEGWGGHRANPFRGGGYGYFLEPHIKGAFVWDQSGIRIIGIMQVSVRLAALPIPEYLDFHSSYSAPRSRIAGIYSRIFPNKRALNCKPLGPII